ncbi:TIGR00255 family protein [Thermosyntropha lipolytica DSM 11003]|uniref:TIGR00255 family protein n=1 Tax=Thermosyntropha lipolytica DSM 11003 TaxID=1123382 RepID=A0A1M5QF83_9FIRM|nr:YicC/YloC family endoribonuclease [Thermosyntropha lipolytica]SHH12845.1 TIGR00255 family protein [Thermosyntropha lipolytica DSM 11003]
MLKSMTGFGRSQVLEQGYQVTCEIKGVNHRYFDPYIRISRRYGMLEEKIKEELRKYISRGRLEVNINIEKTGERTRNIKLDKELAITYHKYLKDLAENLDISPELKIIDIFKLPEVFTLEDEEEDLETLWGVLQKALAEAMQSVLEMRIKEGRELKNDIVERNNRILALVNRLEERSPQVVAEYMEKLRLRMMEILSSHEVDEYRILQEAAIFADRTNITEEIVRLKSHIKHLHDLMENGEAVGRKCDFLVQEMFREINTVASKANDLEISHIVVDVKAELEKIREQLQNIE